MQMNAKEQRKTETEERIAIPTEIVEKQMTEFFNLREKYYAEEISKLNSLVRKLDKTPPPKHNAITIQLIRGIAETSLIVCQKLQEDNFIFSIFKEIVFSLSQDIDDLASTRKDIEKLRTHLRRNYEPTIKSLRKLIEKKKEIQDREKTSKRQWKDLERRIYI